MEKSVIPTSPVICPRLVSAMKPLSNRSPNGFKKSHTITGSADKAHITNNPTLPFRERIPVHFTTKTVQYVVLLWPNHPSPIRTTRPNSDSTHLRARGSRLV